MNQSIFGLNLESFGSTLQVNGIPVYEIKPYKTYIYFNRTTKSKVGKRSVRVRRFNGYKELLENGVIWRDSLRNAFFMNSWTYNELKRNLDSRSSSNPDSRPN